MTLNTPNAHAFPTSGSAFCGGTAGLGMNRSMSDEAKNGRCVSVLGDEPSFMHDDILEAFAGFFAKSVFGRMVPSPRDCSFPI